jgi:hypothetical protein
MVGCTERTITFPCTIGATANSKKTNAQVVSGRMQHCLGDGQHRMVAELKGGCRFLWSSFVFSSQLCHRKNTDIITQLTFEASSSSFRLVHALRNF